MQQLKMHSSLGPKMNNNALLFWCFVMCLVCPFCHEAHPVCGGEVITQVVFFISLFFNSGSFKADFIGKNKQIGGSCFSHMEKVK